MKLEMKKTVCIMAASMGMISGTIGMAEEREPIRQEPADMVKPFKQVGKFQEVKIVNKLIGFKVELFLNENEPGLEVSQKDQAKLDFSGIKGGYKNVNWLNFIVTNLKTNETIASGKIELDWVTKDKATVLQEVMSRLKKIGITASIKVEEEPGDILVITIEKASIKGKKHKGQ